VVVVVVGGSNVQNQKNHHSVAAGWYCDVRVGEHDL